MLKPHLGKILVLLLSILLVGAFHFRLISNPNSLLLGDTHDGFKNYYTLIYHIKHDSTYSRFEGMNYPYGEQVVFTDNQPLLSNSLKFISNNLVDISAYTVGILNTLMLLSIVITCYILFLLFKRFRIPDLWAVLFAIGIGFMAPQVHRMSGHYALSYGFIIPLIMLLWVRFKESPLLKNSLAIGAVVLMAALLHMYYFALSAFFLAGYWVLTNIAKRKKEHLLSTLVHLFLQVILPFVILQLWFILTDSVDDRPADPYGFLAYRAHWQGIFLPITYPLGNFIHSIKALPQIEWEGISYVGIIPGLIFLRYLVLLSWKIISSKGKTIVGITTDPTLNYLFLTSFCILIFAFGYPFKLNLEFLLEYLGPLKQFRSIGRFSWVFFYAANLIAFIVLYSIIDALNTKKVTSTVLLSLSVAILFYESYTFHNHRPFYALNKTAELASPKTTEFRKNAILGIDTGPYQAILPLPYFHSGSENMIVHDRGTLGKKTMLASILSGLPLCAVNMSRTSLSQSLNNIQLILEPYSSYKVFDTYPSNKPLLLWIEKGAQLSEDERTLVNEARFIYEDGKVSLAVLEIQQFYDILNERYRTTREEVVDSTLHLFGSFLTRDSVLNFYHEYKLDSDGIIKNWDSEPSTGDMSDKNEIFNATLPMQDTVPYVLSLWVNFQEDLQPTARVFFDELSPDGELVFSHSWSFGELAKLLDDNWALLEYKFKPHAKDNRMRFTLTRETFLNLTITWNHLMIRPAANDIYMIRDEQTIYKNGRKYGAENFLRAGD
ncbi:MAG: hypothetical protein JKY52_14020 [Flavobacteriales bacterium]|nr:hypothetical protein [Flavobacteriales bacterium]